MRGEGDTDDPTDGPSAFAVHTDGRINRVADDPRTPIRTLRVPPELWDRAMRIAEKRGESLSQIMRAALERYVRRHEHELGEDAQNNG